MLAESESTRVHCGECYFLTYNGEQTGDRSGKPVLILSETESQTGTGTRSFVNYLPIARLTGQETSSDGYITLDMEGSRLDGSIVVCTRVGSAYTSNLGDFIGIVGEEQVKEIKTSVMANLGFQAISQKAEQLAAVVKERNAELESLKEKCQYYETAIEHQREQLLEYEAKESQQPATEPAPQTALPEEPNGEINELEFERDFYREQYHLILGKLMEGLRKNV